jgi:hypothetical protein
MERTLRHARARATKPSGNTTSTRTGETYSHDRATENNNNEGVKGDEAESASREDTSGEVKTEEGADAVSGEAGRVAESMDTNNNDYARECHEAGAPDGRGESEGKSQGEARRTSAEEHIFYTARETMATRLTTTRGGRAMSEAPSVAIPLKPRWQKEGLHRRRERATGGIRRLITVGE